MATQTLMNTESSVQLVTHEAKLRKLHKLDPFNTEMNTLELGQRESVVSRQECTADGELVIVLYHERTLTELMITIDGDFEIREQWLSRNLIYKDPQGSTVVQELTLAPELGETPMPHSVPDNIVNMTGVLYRGGPKTFSKEARQAITAGLGKNPKNETLAPIIKHYLDTKSSYTNTNVGPTLMGMLYGATDAAELAANAFGEHNLRADLTKAVASCQLFHLRQVCALWDQSMPIDWAVAALRYLKEANDTTTAIMYQRQCQRKNNYARFSLLEDTDPGYQFFETLAENQLDEKILRHLDSPSRKRLLQRKHSSKDARHFSDGLDNLANLIEHNPMLAVELPSSVRNWADLEQQLNNFCAHARAEIDREEQVAEQVQLDLRSQWLETAAGTAWLATRNAAEQKAEARQRALREKELERLAKTQARFHALYLKVTTELADTTFASGFSYQVATQRAQLNEWSRVLHNCIASYDLDPARTHRLLVGVYQDHTLIANVEIDLDENNNSVEIGQIAGKYNDYGVQGARALIMADLARL